jgi:hypothetical protein
MKPRAAIILLYALAALATTATTGCFTSPARLAFPYRKLVATTQPQSFDVNHDGKPDFSVTFTADGAVDSLNYDDDQDGHDDRVYHLADVDASRVPHLVILLDSIPYQVVADRYAAGEFRFFPSPPSKVVAPFPSLTEICYTDVLHAAPLSGAIDQHYDRRTAQTGSFWPRLFGSRQPWERKLDYRSAFREEPLCYVDPKKWYAIELERARKAFDESPHNTTIVYLTSASGMACKFGRPGIDEVLDGAARLCLQLLYERHGEIRISMMADHGHNMVTSTNIDVIKVLKSAGFNVTSRLRKPNDVVPEISGLVTYAGVRTLRPAPVADALLAVDGVDLAMYQQQDQIIVRDPQGAAAIDMRDGKLRYRPITRDVLHYAPVYEAVAHDDGGFATRSDLFAATIDHEFPDAPARIWDAFHGRLIVDPPEVIFTTRDGICAGRSSFEHFITMRSTHGSLNQLNSATFLFSMTPNIPRTLRSADVMPAIEPGLPLSVKLKP